MSVISEDSVFTSLKQQGPLAVEDSVNLCSPFSARTRTWVKCLCYNRINATKYRALRSQIFEFLGIESFSQIPELLNAPEMQAERSRRAFGLLGNMFGLHGTAREVEARVQQYARTADAVANSLKVKILKPYASYIATTNEIEVANDPVTLLLIMFNDRYHKKARFEARRKLVLMTLAGSIDQRERETQIEEKFSAFLHFLNDYVWSKSQKIGEHDIIYLKSTHNPEDYSCQTVTVIDSNAAAKVTIAPGTKLTLLKRRRFRIGNKDIPIYVSIRKKPPEAKVLKLLRKNEKNPAVAVDDELGLMAVLDSVADIKTFQYHMTRSASKADSFMVLEDITDTLSGPSPYQSSAIGSSTKTEMIKFFARLGGMRVEFIIHTNRSWLNYMYQKDVAHDEYEVKRLFDTGVMELLFPADIYHLDHHLIRNDMIRRFRARIEE
ncbi:hypothetical protein [Desulforhopalus singaporensis]|uniref:Uncharacterized protein n=1 Tax=Desulforhopalus singaporensis TaxID=91360 RepID=A0A1H0U9A0_9BACT|nr:hypothetical protein [Desulforhopalus singaporensis]SDP62721.1 hypothetical protein SAMN05660330_03437 [Desulforhopalus singaporensis]